MSEQSRVRAPRASVVWGILVVAATAFAMAAPSLRGQFISGDDVQLIRDHVLVNHPSLTHAIKLFGIIHRDLYQPIPLLSFQIDFVLFGGRAWGLHLTNVVLHVACAVFVYWFVLRMCSRPLTAVVAGVAFAVHPLQVESVAWLSGRTMLLSTLFALASLIAFDAWRKTSPVTPSAPGRARRDWLLALGLLLVALTMMSKVRVALPALLVLMVFYQRVWPERKWWAGWVGATLVTAAFTGLAVFTTAKGDIFAKAAEQMTGPRLARALQALGWYLQHYAWPAGLGPWHPPAAHVSWSDAEVLKAMTVVIPVLCVFAAAMRWGRTGPVGMTWFLATIASTLHVVAARSVLAAERYAYLPNIGLHWAVAAGVVFLLDGARATSTRRSATIAATLVLVTIGCAWLGVSWQVSGYYADSLSSGRRTAQLYPDEAGVHEQVAWAHIRAGRYEEAVALARKELSKPGNPCTAYQTIAWARFQQGRYEDAEKHLLRAKAADPQRSEVYFRLGRVYEEKNNPQEALRMYRRALELTEMYLPAAAALAKLHLGLGQLDEAEQAYQRVLKINRYHPPAIYNLADIMMRRGRYHEAATYLQRLLSWMPEHVMAHVNLGVCLARLGDPEGALTHCRQALALRPNLLPAALNRAGLLAELGRDHEAERQYRAVLGDRPTNREALIAWHDFLAARRREAEAMQAWHAAARREPDAVDLQAWLAWSQSLAGHHDRSVRLAKAILEQDPSMIMARLAVGWCALNTGEPERAADAFEAACTTQPVQPEDALERARRALADYGAAHPDEPWPYYIVAVLLAADGQHQAALAGFDQFLALRDEPDSHQRVARTKRQFGLAR